MRAHSGRQEPSETIRDLGLRTDPRQYAYSLSSRPVTEGRLIKRLQTRGGMRWPGGSVGDAARSFSSRRFKPRFVPACLPHVAGPHRRGPWCRSTASHSPLGPQRWIGLQKRPEMGSPPGAVRSRPRNTVRGTPWLWRTCGYPDFSMPRCREASRSVGPSGPNASRAPSVLLESCGRRNATRACPGPTKEYGR